MLPRHHAGKFTEFNFTDSSSSFLARRFDSFTGAFVRSEKISVMSWKQFHSCMCVCVCLKAMPFDISAPIATKLHTRTKNSLGKVFKPISIS